MIATSAQPPFHAAVADFCDYGVLFHVMLWSYVSRVLGSLIVSFI